VTDHVIAARPAFRTLALDHDAAGWTLNDDVAAGERDLLPASDRVSREAL